jgi:hypothetical protein
MLLQSYKTDRKSPLRLRAKKKEMFTTEIEMEIKRTDFSNLKMPQTDLMLFSPDPERAFEPSHYRNQGVGLMRNLRFRIHQNPSFSVMRT